MFVLDIGLRNQESPLKGIILSYVDLLFHLHFTQIRLSNEIRKVD